MTQLEYARKGQVTDAMKKCASAEDVSAEIIRRGLAEGTMVITQNVKHSNIPPLAIGKGLRTKVNANVGTSVDHNNIEEELEKVRAAVEAGADTIMDLSTGPGIDETRKAVMKASTVPVGTVPIYQAAVELPRKKNRPMVEMTAEDLFQVIERHGEDGVDFITVHCGVTRNSVEKIKKEGRMMGVVSRGGAILVEWMDYNKQENPLFEHYDRLLEIAKAFDMTLSLGDGLRPGCLADATDRGQVQELILLGELTERAWAEGVQVMIEGPGHVPLDQIEANILLEKRLCHGAPFYVLGPLVTDIAPGYDHITGAIGGAIAARAGADFLCYVTPSEHLRLPTVDDVREGVIASRIAGHAADIARGLKGSLQRDCQMAQARKSLNWQEQIRLSIDPLRARKLRESSMPKESDVCTMCGELCAIKKSSKVLS
ncbi:MAG TPA: phosphomethylpyrimidine synthase ThiC [Thermodesulfobacteriota bacterium]|nr:phosphomethylpyrimidine synthase ThiC [Thermodesulfobacteriota bacterium]